MSNQNLKSFHILILGSIFLITSSMLCVKKDNLDNVDQDTCQYKAMVDCKYVNFDFSISSDQFDHLLDGEWDETSFLQSMNSDSWAGDNEDMVRDNYSFNGKRINFDGRTEYEDEYGNIWTHQAEVEIIFSDDFEYMEEFRINIENTASFDDGYYNNTRIELRNLRYEHCFLGERNDVIYKIGGFKVPDYELTQDNIIEFYSKGEAINFDWDVFEWDVDAMKNISEDLPYYPEFIITIHNADHF